MAEDERGAAAVCDIDPASSADRGGEDGADAVEPQRAGLILPVRALTRVRTPWNWEWK